MVEHEYRIVEEVYAHDGPVRAMYADLTGKLLSGNQGDSPNMRVWSSSVSGTNSLEAVAEPILHDHWVTAVISRPGLLVTGCMDSNIRVFDEAGTRLYLLSGHQKGIISFSWLETGTGTSTSGYYLISGSWDGTAKIWDLTTGVCMRTLGPHENGVHVLGLTDGRIATTSTGEAVNGKPANFRLRIWNSSTGEQVGQSISDHAGSIRSIAAVAGLQGFATSANDGTVIMRTSDGSAVGTMFHSPQEDGSPPFILDCAPLDTPSGLGLLSCGEDGSFMVWEGTDAVQSIFHPSCVWCAVSLPGTGGDFVTGGNDGFIRHFSRDPVRTTTPAALVLQQHFEEQVAEAIQRRRKGPSNEEIEKAAKWEHRSSNPGKSDGQVMVFNKDGKMIAAQWTSDSATWFEIGEVTGSGDGGEVNGRTYDHVLPVEIETPQGVRTLSLGYNNLENPFDSAQRFIEENSLDQNHLRQIAEWISSRAGNNTPTLDMGGAAAGGGGGGGGGGQSSSSYSSSSTPAPVPKKYQFIPLTAYVVQDDVPNGLRSKVLPKIIEFNFAEGSVLGEAEIDALGSVLEVLANTSYYHSSTVSAGQISCIAKLTAFDTSRVFPGFDICRMLALHPAGSQGLADHHQLSAILTRALTVLKEQEREPGNAAVTALRFLMNTFRYDGLRRSVLCNPVLSAAAGGGGSPAATLLHVAASFVSCSSKPARAAASALIVNIIIGLGVSSGTSAAPTAAEQQQLRESVPLLLTVLLQVIAQPQAVDEVFRTLIALGSLLLSAAGPQAIEQARQIGVHATLESVVIQWGDRLTGVAKKCIEEVSQIVKNGP